MALPHSILTPADADALVMEAATLAGIKRTVWDAASPESKQAALDAGWMALASTPGYALCGRTGDRAVRLATVVEALVRLAMQSDSGAATRAVLQAQGVQEAQVGTVREVYTGRPRLHPATQALLYRYKVGVRLA